MAAAAAAAALLTAAAALLSLRDRPAQRRRPLAGLDAAAIVRLELGAPKESSVFEKRGGAWLGAGGAPADAAFARGLAAQATALTLDTIVARDPQSYDSYGLTESSAVRLRVFAEGQALPALDGYFGSEALGEALYFRFAKEDPVYLATGVKKESLSPPAAR